MEESSEHYGISVQGVDSQFQIIEEDCSDGDDIKNSRAFRLSSNNALTIVAGGLQRTSKPTVFGEIAVSKSDHVQFGDNTYFNGPVTIKQVIRNSGVDNESYGKTDFDDAPNNLTNSSFKHDPVLKRWAVRTWHKVALLGLSTVIIVAALCSALFSMKHVRDIALSPDIIYGANSSSNNPLIIAPHHLRIVQRADWLAQPPEGQMGLLHHPVPWVIIAHTATDGCTVQSNCVKRVRIIQQFHIESQMWSDIGYNWLIGGDGSAYVGRGWDYEGAHTKGYNNCSIGLGVIGTFNNYPPDKQQIEALKKLIKLGVDSGKVAKDYKLLAHRQLWATKSPGDELYNIIEKWPHFVKHDTIEHLLANIHKKK